MKGITEIKVRGYHLDMFMHVNNARYLEFLEEARWGAMENSNLTPGIFAEKGWGFAVVNININYITAAGFGSELVIKTGLKKIGNKSITLDQNISLKGTGIKVVDAEVTFVILDINSNKAIEITDEIKELWFGQQ